MEKNNVCRIRFSNAVELSCLRVKRESSDSDSNSADGVTTLLMYQVGDKPENFDQLMEIANKRIEEKINARIDLQYIGWGDWDQKMSTIISSGENYDISFASNFVANAQKEHMRI